MERRGRQTYQTVPNGTARIEHLPGNKLPGYDLSGVPPGRMSPFSIPTRYASAIRTWRGTPTLQHSITPRGRIRGRGRGQPVRRSFLRSLVGSSVHQRSRKNEAITRILAPSSDEH